MLAKVKVFSKQKRRWGKDETTFTERKRRHQRPKRSFRTQTSLAKAKTPFIQRKIPPKRYNAFTERKRRSQRRNSVCPEETSLPKLKTRSPNTTSHLKRKTGLFSENVARKGENAFSDRKRRSYRRKKSFTEHKYRSKRRDRV